MVAISRVLLFALHLSLSRALLCQPPFSEILNVCLFVSNQTKSWCEAQAFCFSIGGELVRGNSYLRLKGKTFSGQPPSYWVGLTDYKEERNSNQGGWRWTDGSLEPNSEELEWNTRQTNEASQDCVRQCLSSGSLCNSPCEESDAFVCQQRSLPSSAARSVSFRATSIPDFDSEEQYAEGKGCGKMVPNVVSKIQCARVCMSEKRESCVAFYFKEASKECRLVLFTDATVKMEDAGGWKKFEISK